MFLETIFNIAVQKIPRPLVQLHEGGKCFLPQELTLPSEYLSKASAGYQKIGFKAPHFSAAFYATMKGIRSLAGMRVLEIKANSKQSTAGGDR